MYRAFRFRLYPSDIQRQKINKIFGTNRFVYNYYLSKMQKEGYKCAGYNIKDYYNNLRNEYLFLKEANYILIKKTLFTLEDNCKRNFKNKKTYPKYRSKHGKNSYIIPIDTKYKKANNVELDMINKVLKLPDLGNIKIRGYKKVGRIDGRMISIIITKERNGKYYVSILFEQLNHIKVIPSTIVGIDIGIKKLVTLSDGTTFNNNNYISKYESQIKKEQYKLSKKQMRSKNYYKNLKKINILYIKLSNTRKYYINQITKKITDQYDIICTETLKVQEMITSKENNLAKKISDATFNEIIKQLEFKANTKGKFFYQVDAYFPSSQICSACGNIDKKYKNLAERKYICNKCGQVMDRDLNASINIMFEGLKKHGKKAFSTTKINKF